MNIDKITEICNTKNLPPEYKERLILRVISEDENALPDILTILSEERCENKELLLDTNLELSRAFLAIEDTNVKFGAKSALKKDFVSGEIRKHYLKWADRIKCVFKVKGLP